MTGFEPMFPAEEEHEGLVEEEIEGLADIDPTRTDGQHEQDSWRGVAVEDVDDVTGTLAGFLRKRSRKLLGLILRPHVKSLVWAGFLIAIRTLCVLAGPLLVEAAIDSGIPPLLPGGSGEKTTIIVIVVAYMFITVVNAATFNLFFLVTGRVGQDILLDLRSRVFDHFQKLSLSFHERYTSGRVQSRLSSDVEALAELLNQGFVNLVNAVLLIGGISVVLLVLDWQLALAVLAVFPVAIALTWWFRGRAENAYRATREAVALVIVHFTESLAGIRAVHAFRREPRNQEIFDDLDDRYRRALGVVEHARCGVRYRDHVPRAAHHRDRAPVRRRPGALGPDDRGRAGGVPAVPAALLRADAGPEPVLHTVPRRGGCTREARGRARRGAGRARDGAPGSAPGSKGPTVLRERALRVQGGRDPARPEHRHPGRADTRAGGCHRGGQDDDRPSHGALLRSDLGTSDARRHRPARPVRRRAATARW